MRLARLVPVAGLLLLSLAGCQDDAAPTAPSLAHPAYSQVASAPVVTSLADPGDGTCDDAGTGDGCTLREAIAFAAGGATITFAPGLSGMITLSGTTELYINKSLTVTGPGANTIAVSGNDVERVGGVFWVVGGTSTISGLTIRDGLGWGNGGGGVVVSNIGTALTLENCVLKDNLAGSRYGSETGGAIYVSENATLTISSCTLTGNTAPRAGQAIYQYGGTLTIVNSTISGNGDAAGEPAIYLYDGVFSLDHSTVTANYAGVQNRFADVYLKGSLISGNTSWDVYRESSSAFSSLGHNLIGTGTGASGLNPLTDFAATGDQTGVTNPMLDALALNSPGTTPTHALQAGSPAIDAGVCTVANGSTLLSDQRGVSRPQGSACDIGAYEKESGGGLLTPAFTFDLAGLPAKTYGDAPFDIDGYAAHDGDGVVTFTLGAGSVGCTVSATGTVSITSAATGADACRIDAWLASDGIYAAAGPIPQGFGIAKATTTVAISNLPSSGTAGGGFTPTYSTSSDGTTSATSSTPAVCTVSAGTVTFGAAGTCTLVAHVAAGTNWLAADGADQNVVISGATPQTPDFSFNLSTLPAKTYGDGSFGVASYASSTNSSGAITFALGAGSAGCSVTSGGSVTIEGTGSCIIEAMLAASGLYAGAGPLSQSFGIGKAGLTVTANNATITYLDATPTFGVGYAGFVGSDGPAALGGTLAYTFEGTGGTSYGPATTPPTNAGTYSITPSGLSSANYAFSYVAGTFTINKAVPDLAIMNLPGSGEVGSGFIPSVEADGTGATSVTSNTTDICTVDAATGYVSFLAPGTCAIVAHVTESTNYVAADAAPSNITVVGGGSTEFSSSCTYRIHPRSRQLQVTIEWANADPGVSLVQLVNGVSVSKELTPTPTGELNLNLKGEEGFVAYRLWGAASKKGPATPLMDLTACTAVGAPGP